MVRIVLFCMLTLGTVAYVRGNETNGIIDGMVHDHRTGDPVSDAHIILRVGLVPFAATTDSSGRFAFTEVPEGNGFRLEIRHPMYGGEDISVDVKSGSISHIKVALTTPVLRLVVPNGGEVLFAGSVYRIVWQAAGIDRVAISFSADGGRSWLPVASNVDARAGEYEWDIPDVPGTSCLIRIETMDGEVADTSDVYFRIGST